MLKSIFYNESAVLKVAAFSDFIIKMALILAFFCEYCEIFMNFVFTEHSLLVATSAPVKNS